MQFMQTLFYHHPVPKAPCEDMYAICDVFNICITDFQKVRLLCPKHCQFSGKPFILGCTVLHSLIHILEIISTDIEKTRLLCRNIAVLWQAIYSRLYSTVLFKFYTHTGNELKNCDPICCSNSGT